MSKVAAFKCAKYSDDEIAPLIREIFHVFSLKSIIKPRQRVLLKPNLLINLAPEKGATTHPLIVKAVADEVKRLGALPFLGDSPGGIGAMYKKVLTETGLHALGIPIVDFEGKGIRRFDNPRGNIDPIYVSNEVLSFDHIINIPKMKTHELTRITCGIKNMFGCVPGLHKVKYHFDAPNPDDFSLALVDLFAKVKPAITIVDAIVSMEGNGPTQGMLRNTNLIIASNDTVSVDAICSKLMGYDPMEIMTTKIAHSRNLGEGRIDHIEIIGEPICAIQGFVKASAPSSLINKIPPILKPLIMLLRPIIDMLKVRPRIYPNRCVKCLMCVKSCPARAIDPKTFKIDENKCIMCFCCRELCKYGAVEMKESILWKILKQRTKRT